MKVLVLAEFYPSRRDPVLGIWSHRQARAAVDAGAEVRVLVLHRLVPPRAAFARGPAAVRRALASLLAEPREQVRDGIDVRYVTYVSPPRERAYARWGAWAAPALVGGLTFNHPARPSAPRPDHPETRQEPGPIPRGSAQARRVPT